MPHTYDPQSLQDLCCKNIGENMDSLWCKHYNEHIHGKEEYMYLLGPFSSLPGVLLSRLIVYLKSHGLKIGHLQLLLDHSLLDLDLSRLSNNMGGILNTITNRCANLRHLDLSSNGKLPLQGQLALFSTLRQLESINLSNTNTSDRVMSVIGAYCLQLSELDVRCSAVTDLGLNSLATAAPAHTATAGQSLVKLSVDGCDVSPESAYGVLRNMPNIAEFDHPESVRGAERLLLERPERAPLRLSELHGSAVAGLEVAAAGCPDVTVLQLDLQDDESLAPAAQLRRLERLVLVPLGGVCAGLRQLLAACGATLAELVLTGAQAVSAAALLRECRALRRLSLLACEFVDEPALGPPMPHLEQFWLVHEPDLPLPEGLLPRVLAAPDLEHLCLQSCEALSDAAVSAALDSGGLRRLRKLTMEQCDQVGLDAALWVVARCSRLEELEMRGCAQISRRDAAEVRRLAESSGWRLRVDWE